MKYVTNLRQLGWFTGVRREEDEERWRQRVMMGYTVFEEEEEKREDVERTEKTEQTELTADEQRHLAVIEGVLKKARKEDEVAIAGEVARWAEWEDVEADDSDEWLHVTMEGFERMMAEKEAAMQRDSDEKDADMHEDEKDVEENEMDEEEEADEARQQAESIVAAMRGFMGTISGYEGAEIPKPDDTQQPSAVKAEVGSMQQQAAKVKEEAATASKHDASDKAKRQQHLMRVLECDDEKRMLSEVSKYERIYGESSFDRDLMASVGELRLDEDDEEANNKVAQPNVNSRAKDEAKAGKEEVEDCDDETDEGVDDVEEGDDDDELLFGAERGNMRDYLAAMTKQLSGAGLGEDFERADSSARQTGEDDDGDEGESEEDADLNLLKNMLDSLSSQHGMAGPASNLLGAMNVNTAMESNRRRSQGGAGTGRSTDAR